MISIDRAAKLSLHCYFQNSKGSKYLLPDIKVLVIFNRNKVKATRKLSAPIRKNGLEYEERFQVERKRRFFAVIFVILLSRITIKNLPTFTCPA